MSYNNDNDPFWGLKARRRTARMQPLFRQIASHIGRFDTCPLPKCRRAKKCLGCHKPEEIGTSYWKQYPPCIADDDAKEAFKRGLKDMIAKQDAAMRARGEDVEAYNKWAFEQPDLFDDPI